LLQFQGLFGRKQGASRAQAGRKQGASRRAPTIPVINLASVGARRLAPLIVASLIKIGITAYSVDTCNKFLIKLKSIQTRFTHEPLLC
jgi:hypothetical protein